MSPKIDKNEPLSLSLFSEKTHYWKLIEWSRKERKKSEKNIWEILKKNVKTTFGSILLVLDKTFQKIEKWRFYLVDDTDSFD